MKFPFQNKWTWKHFVKVNEFSISRICILPSVYRKTLEIENFLSKEVTVLVWIGLAKTTEVVSPVARGPISSTIRFGYTLLYLVIFYQWA